MRCRSGSAGQGRGGERRLSAARQLSIRGFSLKEEVVSKTAALAPLRAAASPALRTSVAAPGLAALLRMSPRGTQVRAAMGIAHRGWNCGNTRCIPAGKILGKG